MHEHRCRERLPAPGGRRQHRHRARLTRRRKVERGGKSGADEAMRRSGVEQDGDATRWALHRRQEARQARLEVGMEPVPWAELGRGLQRRQLRPQICGQSPHRLVDPIGSHCRRQVVERRLCVPRRVACADAPQVARPGRRPLCRIPRCPHAGGGRGGVWWQEGPRWQPLRRGRPQGRLWGALHSPPLVRGCRSRPGCTW